MECVSNDTRRAIHKRWAVRLDCSPMSDLSQVGRTIVGHVVEAGGEAWIDDIHAAKSEGGKMNAINALKKKGYVKDGRGLTGEGAIAGDAKGSIAVTNAGRTAYELAERVSGAD